MDPTERYKQRLQKLDEFKEDVKELNEIAEVMEEPKIDISKQVAKAFSYRMTPARVVMNLTEADLDKLEY